MSFRTVVISNRCKLDLRMNYMEVRGDNHVKILLDDIETLIIENPAVSFTGCLLEALSEKKVKVIFCNQKHNPYAELTSYYGSHDCSRKLKKQIAWSDEIKGYVWTNIVSDKIKKQSELLNTLGYKIESDLLKGYILNMLFMDSNNREGHAAKVYFNKLFGMSFTRNQKSVINAALDYGYSIILSVFNKEIVYNGYLTQLGIFHDNIYNQYNLSCDLMEPFRILVDKIVVYNNFNKFETEEKRIILEILQEDIKINGTTQTFTNAVKIYTKSVLDALCNEDAESIIYYEL